MNKLKKAAAFTAAMALTAVQFASAGLFNVTAADTAFKPYTIEAEDAEDAELGPDYVAKDLPKASGKGFAYLTAKPFSFDVEVPEEAMYDITARCAQILSQEGRMQTVSVNGIDYTYNLAYSKEWKDVSFGVFRLKKGVNTISFKPSYGYAEYDTITVSAAELPELKGSAETCDPKATAETKSLMKYLNSIYGKNVLSGQQEIYGGGHGVNTTIRYDAEKKQCIDSDGKVYDTRDEVETEADDHSKFVWHCWDEDGQEYTYDSQNRGYKYNDYGREIKYLRELTGDAPAIRGFDFGSNCPCYYWDDGVTKRMIDWTVNQNGICTASWHINVPQSKADYTLGEPLDFSKTTYSEKTDFKPSNVMKEGTMEYDYFKLCMKNLANQLLELQEAGVPVLWRPFHEAEGNPSNTSDPLDGSGSWFWWAKEGAAVYKELWQYLYTTLTEEYGIHNLIWEQNLYAWSEASGQWYVGDDWVDIVGFDKYDTQYNRHDGKTSGPNEDSNSKVFWSLVDYVDNKKMVAMPENSTIPSVPNMTVEHANWLYFCTWYDEESSPKFISGEEYNDADTVKATYQSDYCITLSELPKNLFKASGSSDTTTTTKKPDVTTTTTTATASQPVDKDVVYGDANCDKEVNVSDAVLIMQSISNPEKYGLKGSDKGHLTEKGAKNADCESVGNGVTNKDALAIQKFTLGLTTLPETAKD